LNAPRRLLSAVTAARSGWLTDSELAVVIPVVIPVVQGLTNREVAERLFISPQGVPALCHRTNV
jgi:FixJ family two-component response regulator